MVLQRKNIPQKYNLKTAAELGVIPTLKNIMENPFEKFNTWWKSALTDSPLKQKNAVCISTIDSNGYPSGRFVDLKAVNELGFTFCTYLSSAKGEHINENAKIALTLW
nr:pyridoxamine 5'-phosphate oxidase family protein [uncultured Undibacterium sp.]